MLCLKKRNVLIKQIWIILQVSIELAYIACVYLVDCYTDKLENALQEAQEDIIMYAQQVFSKLHSDCKKMKADFETKYATATQHTEQPPPKRTKSVNGNKHGTVKNASVSSATETTIPSQQPLPPPPPPPTITTATMATTATTTNTTSASTPITSSPIQTTSLTTSTISPPTITKPGATTTVQSLLPSPSVSPPSIPESGSSSQQSSAIKWSNAWQQLDIFS